MTPPTTIDAQVGAEGQLPRAHTALAPVRLGPDVLVTPDSAERSTVKLIAEAHTNDDLAGLLSISRKTVERHRENILAKLGMRDRVQLTRYAIRRGLVEP